MKKYNKILTKEFLEKEYIKNKKSSPLIAKIIKGSANNVRYYLKKYNITITYNRLPTKSKYYDILTEKFLIKEYTNNKKSMNQISKKIKCAESTVCHYLKKYNIPRRALSESTRGISKNKNNKSAYIDGRCSKIYYCIICGGEIHYRTWKYGNKKCGKCYQLGHKVTKTTRNKISKANKGKRNGNYISGTGHLPYTSEFTNILKTQIKKRDNFTCQYCGMTKEEHFEKYGRDIEVHHINYCTFNCNKNNLITLCKLCNMKANKNRDYWYAYYKYIRIT